MNDKNTLIYEAFISETDDTGKAISYGLKGRRVADGKIVEENQIGGIFTSLEKAESFAELLVKNGIYPCHMEDIAEDML